MGLLTFFSMTKIWGAVFWGKETQATEQAAPGMVGATVLVVALSLTVAAFAGPLADLAARAAGDLVDPAVYAELVLGAGR